ncbi:MAG: cytochrome-c peroxidase [Gammaproteobacteria bacterium]
MNVKSIIGALALTATAGFASAAQWEALPGKAPEPADNPSTPAKVKLGQILFLDPRLSSTGTVSCNSCHNVMLGGEDNRPVAMGVNGQTGGRSAPTVWNAAFNSVQFWDGRAPSLEAQAAGPVTNPIEMGMKSWDDVVKRLKSIPGYADLFAQAFGSASAISKENAVKAIAAYERTLITPDSAYDKYVQGDQTALSEQQIRGMNKFAEVGCANCHSGPAFNGPEMPEGTGFFMKFPVYENKVFQSRYKLIKDKGRFAVTSKAEDKNTWKVPTLRNVALTAPYFHNGGVKTLDRAVELMAKMQLDKALSANEIKDIVAFLNALSGPFPKQELPQLPGTPGSTLN